MQQLETILLIKYRDLSRALRAAEEGIDLAVRTGYQASYYYFWAYKMSVHVYLGDFKGAEESFERLRQIQSELRVTPYHNSPFLLARFSLALAKMSIAGAAADSDGRAGLRSETLRFGFSRGVSNELTAPRAQVKVEEGCLLLVHGPSPDE